MEKKLDPKIKHLYYIYLNKMKSYLEFERDIKVLEEELEKFVESNYWRS